jgi:hypothetical protein
MYVSDIGLSDAFQQWLAVSGATAAAHDVDPLHRYIITFKAGTIT